MDLNLLIALDALLTERNVTRAAERICISQPAMSAALQKLRRYFSDQLLDRIGRRLELTPRAKELAEPVKSILLQIRLLEKEREFLPASAQRVFRVGMSTGCSDVFLPRLIQHLACVAPLVKCQVDDLLAETVPRLLDGGIDFAITVSERVTVDAVGLDEPFMKDDLFSDRFVVVVALDNWAVGERLTYDEFCQQPYIETRFHGDHISLAERALSQLARRPEVRAWLPSFQQTLQTVSQSEMLAIVPSRLYDRYKNTLPVRALEVPIALPEIHKKLYWHPRNNLDRGHQWFRGLLKQIAGSDDAGVSRKDMNEVPLLDLKRYRVTGRTTDSMWVQEWAAR